MRLIQLVPYLLRTDMKLFLRDRFLVAMSLFVFVIAIVIRFGLPWVAALLAEKEMMPGSVAANGLSYYYPLIVSFFTVFEGALLAGNVFGFVLLDEKEDNTIKVMLVSPVSLDQYLLYRNVFASLMTFVLIVCQLLIINLAMIPHWKMLLIAAGGSLASPIVAMTYANFAENKVQGMAMAKIFGCGGLLILISWFMPEPVQWLFGIFPPYWACKAYWLAHTGNITWPIALAVGVGIQLAVIVWLTRRFRRVASV